MRLMVIDAQMQVGVFIATARAFQHRAIGNHSVHRDNLVVVAPLTPLGQVAKQALNRSPAFRDHHLLVMCWIIRCAVQPPALFLVQAPHVIHQARLAAVILVLLSGLAVGVQADEGQGLVDRLAACSTTPANMVVGCEHDGSISEDDDDCQDTYSGSGSNGKDCTGINTPYAQDEFVSVARVWYCATGSNCGQTTGVVHEISKDSDGNLHDQWECAYSSGSPTQMGGEPVGETCYHWHETHDDIRTLEGFLGPNCQGCGFSGYWGVSHEF